MAKPVSEEELTLKKRARRRLIGAIALVAAVAALLPMVLDSEPKPTSKDISIHIPSPEAKGPVTKVPPSSPEKAAPKKVEAKAPETVTETPPAKVAEAPPEKARDAPPAKGKDASPVKAAEKPAAPLPDNPNDVVLNPRLTPEPAPAKSAKAGEKSAEKAPAKAAEKPPEKTPEKTAAAKAAPGSYFIQVMALADADKARQTQKQMADAGVRAYTESVTTASGKVTRVRAGPFASREEAERAHSKLQGMGLDGKVAGY